MTATMVVSDLGPVADATVKGLATFMMESTWRSLCDSGEAYPAWFIVGADDQLQVAVTPWKDDDEKLEIIGVMVARVLAAPTRAIALVVDTYVRVLPLGQKWDGVRPSDSLDRTDALMVTAHSADGDVWSVARTYSLDDAGAVTRTGEEDRVIEGEPGLSVEGIFDPVWAAVRGKS